MGRCLQRRGDGDLIEVVGSFQSGDLIVKRANDEIREGASTHHFCYPRSLT